MSKQTQREALWHEEVTELGLAAAIADRLSVHGGVSLQTVVTNTGCGRNTAQRHLDRLVENGSATKQSFGDDWMYRPI